MKELVWIFPILFSMAVVFSTCRSDTYGAIFRGAIRSFVKMVFWIALSCVALYLLLDLLRALAS